jgi:hypothetical protein
VVGVGKTLNVYTVPGNKQLGKCPRVLRPENKLCPWARHEGMSGGWRYSSTPT